MCLKLIFVFDIFTRKCGSVASPYELCALLWVEDCQLCFRFLGASSSLWYKQLGRGWGTSKHNCLVSYLLCWRHVSTTVGHLQVTKICIEENYTEYDHSIGAYSKLSRCRLEPTTRSRWKFRICTYTMIILCIVFLYTHLCELKMAHSGRNMSSSA